MRMCQPHWEKLKAAIESRGLGNLIAAHARDAHARAVAELEGKSDLSDYDPLMSAYWQIVGRCTQELGLAMYMGENICPLCEILKPGVYPDPPPGHKYATNESYFIDGPADAELAFAQANGLALRAPSTQREENGNVS